MKYIKNAVSLLIILIFVSLSAACTGGSGNYGDFEGNVPSGSENDRSDLSGGYDAESDVVAYEEIDNNQPDFSENDMTTETFETYAELDALGRCGVAYANISKDIMPDEERGEIGQVKPSGWHTVRYNDLIEGNYLYNRCHLIGYQLAGENANEKNLITGTRYMNVQGMLPFENMVADYVNETDNHVLYRVTPIYEDDNLVASGVQMEAKSVEDEGDGICFNVFVHNIQPGVVIDYETGESERDYSYVPDADDTAGDESYGDEGERDNPDADEKSEYVINTNTKKFHRPSCSSVSDIADYNREDLKLTRKELLKEGYSPCKRCNP